MTDDPSAAPAAELVARAATLATSTLANALDDAGRHRNVIAEFDRFPHRNALLGRSSTPEEVKFLKSKRAPF